MNLRRRVLVEGAVVFSLRQVDRQFLVHRHGYLHQEGNHELGYERVCPGILRQGVLVHEDEDGQEGVQREEREGDDKALKLMFPPLVGGVQLFNAAVGCANGGNPGVGRPRRVRVDAVGVPLIRF